MSYRKPLSISVWLRARIVYASDFARVNALKLDCDFRRGKIRDVRSRLNASVQQLMLLELELQQARTAFVPTVDDDGDTGEPAPPHTKEFFKQQKAARRVAHSLPSEQLKRIDELTIAQASLNEQMKTLKQSVTNLELEENEAINANLLAEQQLQIKIGNMIASASTVVDRTMKKIDKYEARLAEREIAAESSFAKTLAAWDEAKSKRSNADLVAKAEDKENPLTSALSSFGRLIGATDPSVENAYRRLEKQIAAGQKVAEKSEEGERILAQSIECLEIESKDWQGRAEVYGVEDIENPILLQVLSRQKSVDDAAAELSVALIAHKTKNLANAQVLFRVEGIARRLYLLKLLLAALPTKTKDDLLSFAQFVEAVCSYLQSSMQADVISGSDALTQGATGLTQRIFALEQNMLLNYIQFAKSDLTKLNSNRACKFGRDCGSITSALKLDKEASIVELSRWEAVLKQSIEDNMQLLKSVAEQRIEHHSSVIKMADRAIDVLLVIGMAVSG